MAQALGLETLADSRVLDMGCGTKFTQAILEYDIPLGEYIGVDVYEEMIDFLGKCTNDPRFSFFHIDSHNDMYNTDGEKSLAIRAFLSKNIPAILSAFTLFLLTLHPLIMAACLNSCDVTPSQAVN